MVGGIETITGEIVKRLMTKYRLTIASSTLESSDIYNKDLCKFIHIPGVTPLDFLIRGVIELEKAIKHMQFDGVICSSALAAVVYWRSKYQYSTKIIILAHGLDIAYAEADHLYKASLQEIIGRALTIANSRYTERLIKSLFPFCDKKVTTIIPPPRMLDSPSLDASKLNASDVTSNPFLLSVGRAIERKGIQSFISKSLPTIIETYPFVRYIVVGPNSDHPEYISKALASLKKEYKENILFLGYVSDSTLSYLYKHAIALVFPVLELKNNPEGLGLVVLEAEIFGTPSVAFATGGVPDAIKCTQRGRLVETGDYDKFSKEIIDIIETRNNIEIDKCRKTINLKREIENKWKIYVNQINTILDS